MTKTIPGPLHTHSFSFAGMAYLTGEVGRRKVVLHSPDPPTLKLLIFLLEALFSSALRGVHFFLFCVSHWLTNYSYVNASKCLCLYCSPHQYTLAPCVCCRPTKKYEKKRIGRIHQLFPYIGEIGESGLDMVASGQPINELQISKTCLLSSVALGNHKDQRLQCIFL